MKYQIAAQGSIYAPYCIGWGRGSCGLGLKHEAGQLTQMGKNSVELRESVHLSIPGMSLHFIAQRDQERNRFNLLPLNNDTVKESSN